MKQFYLRLIFFFTTICIVMVVVGAPQDHGRVFDDSNGGGLDSIIGYIMLVIIGILGIAYLFTNKDNASSKKDKTKQIQHFGPTYNPYLVKCPNCGGKGWVRGSALGFMESYYHTCPHCLGYRHVLSDEALSICKEIEKIHKENKDETTKHANNFRSSLLRHKLLCLLKDSPMCPHCNGEGHINDFEVEDFDGIKYKVEKCKMCNGKGYPN